jgi:proliferating cell nuclear antigen
MGIVTFDVPLTKMEKLESAPVLLKIPAKELKTIVAILNELSGEVNIGFYPEGIEISSMDSAHVSLIKCRIEGSKLPSYFCREKLVLGIQLEALHMTLSHAKPDCMLTISKPAGSAEVLQVQVEHFGSLARVSTSRLPLIELDEEQFDVEDSDYECMLEMLSSDYKDVINELFSIGDKVEISIEPTNAVSFKLSGDGEAGHEVQLFQASSENLRVFAKLPLKSTFALSYLAKFSKASEFNNKANDFLGTVVIKLGFDKEKQSDKPGYFEFAHRFGSMKFYLATQISND